MRRHKYGAVSTMVDGIRFASKKEAGRYQELKLLKKAGEITGLILQPVFELYELHGQRVAKYIADFAYTDQTTGRRVIEDVKGVRTPVYKLKKRWVEAQYGITIVEI